MAISFNNIPSDVRVPLFYAEMDNSAANSASASMRRLIVAQVNDDVSGPELGSLVLVPSVALAKNIGGQGSMLASMYETWRKADPPAKSGACRCSIPKAPRPARKSPSAGRRPKPVC